MRNGICRVIYDKNYDSYVLELRNKGEKDWGTVMIAKCRPDSEGDPTLIHYTFITQLLQTVSNGYELITDHHASGTRPGLFFYAIFAAKLQRFCISAPARKTAKSRILCAR